MTPEGQKPLQFSLRALCLVVLALAVLFSAIATYRVWRLARVPFDKSKVTRIVVRGGGIWTDGQRSAELVDPEQIARVVTLMEDSSPVGIECGGLEWMSMKCYDADRELACIWVGDYAEWGYAGEIHGYSNDLQSLLIEVLDRHPNSPSRGNSSIPVAP